MANLVWIMPQYALGTAALQQNLAPEFFGDAKNGLISAVAVLFVISAIVIWFYDSGGWGIKLFEAILKILVGIVVLCFFGVVLKMSISTNDLDWGKFSPATFRTSVCLAILHLSFRCTGAGRRLCRVLEEPDCRETTTGYDYRCRDRGRDQHDLPAPLLHAGQRLG